MQRSDGSTLEKKITIKTDVLPPEDKIIYKRKGITDWSKRTVNRPECNQMGRYRYTCNTGLAKIY